MRIVLDLQGAQAESRHRGIGRYSLSLAEAIARQSGSHEILIALNGSFRESIEPIRAAFDGLVPQQNIHVWQVEGPVLSSESGNDLRRRAAELVREAYLASLRPDIVHVSSLFEGLVDDAVTSIGKFTSSLPTAVTLYDLIPYIHRELYLENPSVEKWYEEKLDHLRRADMLLSISESSRREALTCLNVPPNSVVNISTAAGGHFRALDLGQETIARIKEKYGLTRAFVMYTGGIDPRKNIKGLIEAYAGLPEDLRDSHQLAIVCAVQRESRVELEQYAKGKGLRLDELVITGFVPERDLVALYNLCKLFVFPSSHEGFGLPALEAMCCGAAVIAADTSSLPEVIGREDALFDPHSPASICSRMRRALSDEEWRADLCRHGLQRAAAFSWDATAKFAIGAFEKLYSQRFRESQPEPMPAHRPTLAYVAPLPPERSGIADYSAELLPGLAQYYQIIAITCQPSISDPWINANCQTQTPEWLEQHAHEVDRVLYHFGNSEFHEHMFDLIETVPGTVVLHDFFLSGIQSHREVHGQCPYAWTKELYHSHGYEALQDRYFARDTADVVWKYPANLSVLQWAQGVIVHSEASRHLAAQWYGDSLAKDWALIPLLRTAALDIDRQAARDALGLPKDSLIVCSYGLLGPTKLNHRLVSAWQASRLAVDPGCMLIFVGENHPGAYGQELLRQIRSRGGADRIRIVGWTNSADFRRYLAAADVGVQLRALSRGETSATVLDCLNYGLATIVNANGSMADIRDDSVWKLPDSFCDEDLVVALETLADDAPARERMGRQGRELIRERHDPRKCVDQYHIAIESFAADAQAGLGGLVNALSGGEFAGQDDAGLKAVSSTVAANCRLPGPHQLLVDISELVQRDWQSGIQRVVKNILKELIKSPPAGFRVEPVFAREHTPGYFYARSFTSRLLGCSVSWASDDPIDSYPGDIFLGMDLQPAVVPAQKHYLDNLRNRGVKVCFVVYDLLPIVHPECFVGDAAVSHTRWLNTIDRYDKVITISKAVADELVTWLDLHGSPRIRPLEIGWFHLGVDADSRAEFRSDGKRQRTLPDSWSAKPTFLMVGTLEPRKGHAQVLNAFERLWAADVDVNLVIVGKKGWLVDDLTMRLSAHPELGVHLFWEENADDALLEQIYSVAACLIAASKAEGFGLPLIEAARHGLPVMARDIPVFREVAGDHAFYFSADDGAGLAQTLDSWLALYVLGKHPRSKGMPWLTWVQSAECLEQAVFGEGCYISWMPSAKV